MKWSAAGLGAAAVAAALSAFPELWRPEAAVAFLALTWCVTPGALLASVVFRGAPGVLRPLAALALSPFLIGAPFAALVFAGVSAPLAARGLCALVALLSLVAAVLALRAPSAPAAQRTASSDEAAAAALPEPPSPFAHGNAIAFVLATLWTALCAWLLCTNDLLPLRSDGWFHAAVVAQIAQRGVPPEDPYFAGLRLLYFWGSHAWAAGWLALVPTLQPWTPLLALNLSGAFAVVLGVAGIAQRLRANAEAVAGACLLALLGYSPFAWGLIAGRAFTGDVRGWADVVHQAGHGIDPVFATMAAGQLHGSLAFFGDKYLVLTPFGMGLALLALAVAAALALLERPTARGGFALAACVAATLFVHTVVGYALLLLCATWCVVAAVRGVTGDHRRLAALFPILLAVAGAITVLAPYLIEITLGKRGQLSVGLTRKALYSFVVGGAFYIPAGFAWLAARARGGRDDRETNASLAPLALLVPALLVAGMALALRLPENNQSKFLNLLFLLLAAPAALGLQALLDRAGRPLAWLLMAFFACAALPNLGLAIWGFTGERGLGMHAWRATPAQREACDWVRAHTPADAALCDPIVARDLIVHGARSVWWGGPYGERDWGYDPAALQARRDLVSALALGRDPEGAASMLLSSAKREIVLVTRADAPDSVVNAAAVAARSERFERLWGNTAMTFWRVRRPS